MKTVVLAVLAVVAVAAAGGTAYYLMSNEDGSDHDGPEAPKVFDITTPSQWSYVGGDVGSFGVTDSKTPITEGDFRELWKVTSEIDASATAWKTPSSAICVDGWVYYYKGADSSICCADISTGKTLNKVSCPSKTVYNMALAFGDGKIFAVSSTGYHSILYAFDAATLKQLFVSVPVEGGETQGTVTYYDGKVFFGTYSGNYACFSTEDTDVTKSDEAIEPQWILGCDGWYNATPAFFDDYIVLVKRGFNDMGATAFFMDIETGRVIDSVKFDREYASSGATAYEGRVYIPLNRVADRTEMNPGENTAEKLAIRSFKVGPEGFDRSSEQFWESPDSFWNDNYGGSVWGGTQSIPVIWNDTIYIGGGGKTLGSNEPLWIIDIADDGVMSARQYFKDICTKGTPALTTAYATKENGYAVYIYVMEYGHVNEGESIESTNGYADIFVIKDVKGGTAEKVFSIRPEPRQFCYQSFTISKDGYLLLRNDTTLFCFGDINRYDAEDVKASIDRFLEMQKEGNSNLRDYERICARYSALSEEDKSKVTNYADLEAACITLTLKAASGDVTIKVPRGAIVDLPDVTVPAGKSLIGWKDGDATWVSFTMAIQKDATLSPVYAESVTVTLDFQNGQDSRRISVAEGSVLPYIPDPSRNGYEFGGWFDGTKQYMPNETAVSGDVVLSARWLKISSLTFDSDGGSQVSGSYYGVYDRPLGRLPSSVRAGFSFVGWFYGEEKYTETTVYGFENGITLKAKWNENPSYTLDNGKGLSVTGKFPSTSSLTSQSLSPIGSTYSRIVNACKGDTGINPDCVLVALKGDGVNSELPITVKVAADSSLNTTVTVYYDQAGTVRTATGTVSGGYLTFEAYGSTISGGIQLPFGVQEDVMTDGSW